MRKSNRMRGLTVPPNTEGVAMHDSRGTHCSRLGSDVCSFGKGAFHSAPGCKASTFRQAFSSRQSQGFTLVELLVVIAIVAILAALLFSGFSKVTQKASLALCLSNHRQIASAMLTYAADHGGAFPNYTEVSGGSAGGGIWWAVPHLIGPYIARTEQDYSKIYYCPALKCNPAEYNIWNGFPDNQDGWMKVDHLMNKRLAQISQPSKTILTCELAMLHGVSFHDPAKTGTPGRVIAGKPYLVKSGNRVVASFVDGHVAYISTYVKTGDGVSPPTGYNPPPDWPDQYRWNP